MPPANPATPLSRRSLLRLAGASGTTALAANMSGIHALAAPALTDELAKSGKSVNTGDLISSDPGLESDSSSVSGDTIGETTKEKLVVKTVKTFLREKTIAEDLYQELNNSFSKEQIIELFTIPGFYQLLAFIIAGFDVPEPQSEMPSFE